MSKKREIYIWLWLAPIGMLIFAMFPFPYGYYKLLRVLVFTSSMIFFLCESDRNPLSKWSVMFLIISIIYNPFFPIHSQKEVWIIINIITAIIFSIHLRRNASFVTDRIKRIVEK